MMPVSEAESNHVDAILMVSDDDTVYHEPEARSDDNGSDSETKQVVQAEAPGLMETMSSDKNESTDDEEYGHQDQNEQQELEQVVVEDVVSTDEEQSSADETCSLNKMEGSSSSDQEDTEADSNNITLNHSNKSTPTKRSTPRYHYYNPNAGRKSNR